VTVAALAELVCLAVAAFGRPADLATCERRAAEISEVSQKHGVDPILMLAIDAWECDLRQDRDVLIYEGEPGHRRLSAIDACPTGYRFRDIALRRRTSTAEIYELAAMKLEEDRRRCLAARHRHSFIAHWNLGNRSYSLQVLAVAGALRGKPPRAGSKLTSRAADLVRRFLGALANVHSRREDLAK
jgi:hypothetical protein